MDMYPHDLTFEGTSAGGAAYRRKSRIASRPMCRRSPPIRRFAAGWRRPDGTPAEFAAAIEEQRVKIAAINKTIQPPAR